MTAPPRTLVEILCGYRNLIADARGARTYAYVFWNGIFHSGVFTWLGLYFSERYRLSEVGIGLALLGYGVPGLLLGSVIGRAADRFGRRWLIPTGVAVAALAAAALIPHAPLVAAGFSVAVLSLGYDMTQPLLAGIVTSLGGKRGGQAMGLNVFALFAGFGFGSLLFSSVLGWGFPAALGVFVALQAFAALLAIPLFSSEQSR